MTMTEYVCEISKEFTIHTNMKSPVVHLEKLWIYANLLKRKLELGMFIPCDLKGNVLEEPEPFDTNLWNMDDHEGFEDCVEYHQALDRVLFEDWSILDKNDSGIVIECGNGYELLYYPDSKTFLEYGTIEDLTNLGIHLTSTGEKQIKG